MQILKDNVQLPSNISASNVVQAILFQDSFTEQQKNFDKSIILMMRRTLQQDDDSKVTELINLASKPQVDFTVYLISHNKTTELLIIDEKKVKKVENFEVSDEEEEQEE